MTKHNYIGIILWMMAQMLYAQNTVTIGKVMYQNQPFSAKNKQIFDADKEGLRVWSLGKAIKYCETLTLDGNDNWRVASKKEFQAIMTKKPSKRGLYVKPAFSPNMPPIGGKYDDVWFWTRFSKAPNLGEYVNLKKAKSGWASAKYKGYVLCTRDAIKKVYSKKTSSKKSVSKKQRCKKELTYSRDWVKVWNTCSGYTALKKDGSLWQFGKVGECGWGQIIPFDPQTGKDVYKEKKIYHLKAKKIGKGFRGAKIINGGYRLYAIKKDGTLWGWGEGLGVEAKKLDSNHNWSDFSVKYEGNGCCGYDVGLKKDGTLWRIPESTFAMGKYKTALKIQKIGQFSDWKKIVLGCCNIYGLRKNGTMWRFSQMKNEEVHFKKFTPKKKSDGGDMELYPVLSSNMAKVRPGTIYSSQSSQERIKANRDGTLCLMPDK